uniref:TBC1 domain family member 13 n=1 Tax=Panagrellus redivivus TaxID=6233 RepID=A0A7E4W6M4_PANRE
MSTRQIERITHIESLLLIENTVIDTKKLREACSYGIPDSLRPLCWRLFLDYLPRDRPNWKVVLAQQRAGYADLVENLIVTPGEQEDRHSAATTSKEVTDHPLSETSTTSEFRENEILIQIDRDVRRLRPEIQFFQKNTDYPFISAARINLAKRISRDRLAVDEDPLSKMSDRSSSEMTEESQSPAVPVKTAEEQDPECELHWQVVERMLFIYSKVNPGIKYVQGMNELIGPIYYVFATDPDREWAEHAEADTFYCFQHLMSEVKDNFIKKLDKSNCGIEIVINKFHERLAVQDPALYHHIAETQQIQPQFYVFRWILLLLSQEFSLPDLITLWDAVFASTDRIDCVQSICLVMLNEIREDLLAGDFSANMRLLQDYPNNIDVANIMIKAYDLRHKKVSNNSARSNSASDTSDISFNSSSQSLTRAADRISAFMTGAKARINQYTNKKKDNS